MEEQPFLCALCGRQVPAVTRHHLMPRSRSLRRRGQVERADDARIELVKGAARPAADETIDLCQACHGMVHAVCSEKELERSYYTRDLLLGNEEIATFVTWVAKQRGDRKISVRRTRERR